jgi:hypothetical protein
MSSDISSGTETERYLSTLARDTFLRLWSYPHLYTDETRKGEGDGKELCDLVVVFGGRVLLFSDKRIRFSKDKPVSVAWPRWYRKAVASSARQLFGAEYWIRRFPKRIFTDKACQLPFPLPLPDSHQVKFHRIAVVSGAGAAVVDFFGGNSSKSLMVSSVGPDKAETLLPFTIFQPYPERGFVHVFDEMTLDLVMRELDTVGDFTDYLDAREEISTRPGLTIIASGEEQMLATYLVSRGTANAKNFGFDLPKEADNIFFAEGFWEEYETGPLRRSRIEANEASYAWDRLINLFSRHALEGTAVSTLPQVPGWDSLENQERIIRNMASEVRTRRRQLANALLEAIDKEEPRRKFARYVLPSSEGEHAYVFVIMNQPEDMTYDEYRAYRAETLWAYCRTARLKRPSLKSITGIATERPTMRGSSEDALYMEYEPWTPEAEREAKEIAAEFDIMDESRMSSRPIRDVDFPISRRAIWPAHEAGVNRAERRRLERASRKRSRTSRKV